MPGALELGARLPAAQTPGPAGGGGGSSGSAEVPGRRYKKAPQTRRTSLDRPLLLLLLPPRSSPPRRRRPAQGTRRCLGGVPGPAPYSRERRARPGPGQDLAAPGAEWGAPRAALRLPPSGGQSLPHLPLRPRASFCLWDLFETAGLRGTVLTGRRRPASPHFQCEQRWLTFTGPHSALC